MICSMMLLPISSLLLLISTVAAHNNAEERLMDDLFHDAAYNKDVIPMLKPSTDTEDNSVEVKVGMDILGMDLSDKGVLTANTWLRIQWNDFRLTWDPAQYEGLKSIRVPSSLIWVPDFEIYNSPDFGPLSSSFQYSQSPIKAVVMSDGKVIFIPPVTVRANCDLPTVDNEPTDCLIKLGSWTYDGYSLKLSAYDDKDYITLTEAVSYGNKGGMVLTSQKGNALQRKFYDCCTEPYYSMEYKFTVQAAYVRGNGSWVENPKLPMALGKLKAKFAEGDSMIP